MYPRRLQPLVARQGVHELARLRPTDDSEELVRGEVERVKGLAQLLVLRPVGRTGPRCRASTGSRPVRGPALLDLDEARPARRIDAHLRPAGAERPDVRARR